MVSTTAEFTAPSISQVKLKVSPVSAVPVAVKSCEAVLIILIVPEEGETREQVGAVFFVTVHS